MECEQLWWGKLTVLSLSQKSSAFIISELLKAEEELFLLESLKAMLKYYSKHLDEQRRRFFCPATPCSGDWFCSLLKYAGNKEHYSLGDFRLFPSPTAGRGIRAQTFLGVGGEALRKQTMLRPLLHIRSRRSELSSLFLHTQGLAALFGCFSVLHLFWDCDKSWWPPSPQKSVPKYNIFIHF